MLLFPFFLILSPCDSNFYKKFKINLAATLENLIPVYEISTLQYTFLSFSYKKMILTNE